MDLDILIDSLTECLVEQTTGIIVDTTYKKRNDIINPKEYKDWKFNWSDTQIAGYTVYELMLSSDMTVQGRISLRIEGGVANVDIAESAPHNYGSNGKYKGVGGHLFAIACKASMEQGCGGIVAFNAKSDLVEYYKAKLQAVEIYPRRMVIFEDAAKRLLDTYMKG